LGGGGGYYSVKPNVAIAAPTTAVRAVGTPVMSAGTVSSMTRTTAGTNYSSAPLVTIAAPPASANATAGTPVISAGKTITSIPVPLNGGGGYYSVKPDVVIGAPNPPVTAAPGAITLTAGAVSGIALGTPGSNYSTAPTVVLSAPPASTAAAVETVVVTNKTLSSIGPSYGLNGKFFFNRATAIHPIATLLAVTPTSTFTQTAAINYSSMPAGTFPSQTSADDFTVVWEGWFDVTKEGLGTYTFGTGSDDGSMIYCERASCNRRCFHLLLLFLFRGYFDPAPTNHQVLTQ
jgi:hypothetical protein